MGRKVYLPSLSRIQWNKWWIGTSCVFIDLGFTQEVPFTSFGPLVSNVLFTLPKKMSKKSFLLIISGNNNDEKASCTAKITLKNLYQTEIIFYLKNCDYSLFRYLNPLCDFIWKFIEQLKIVFWIFATKCFFWTRWWYFGGWCF